MGVVRATGVAVAGRARAPGDRRGPSEAPEIAQAMENAALSCVQEGIDDPATMRTRMAVAREAARARFRRDLPAGT